MEEETFYSILVAKPSDAKDIVDFFNARGKRDVHIWRHTFFETLKNFPLDIIN